MKKLIVIFTLIFLMSGSVHAFPDYNQAFNIFSDTFEVFFVLTTSNLIGGQLVTGFGDTQYQQQHNICDMDNDGYKAQNSSCGGNDCKDGNPNINPGAMENCGDGIDNNCNGLIDLNDQGCIVVSQVCGDNNVGGNEVCDGATVPCTTIANYKGIQSCKSDCSGWNACSPSEYCGDKVKNGNEVCDNDVKSCLTSGGKVGDQECLPGCSGYGLCVSENGGEGSTGNEEPQELCDNSIDDDTDCPGDTNNDGDLCGPGDAGVDCLDSDCIGMKNGYGYFACCASQSDCKSNAMCETTYGICAELSCKDGVNNDEDPYLDCYDWDCSAKTECSAYYKSTEFDCNDGYDNDQDFYYDCDDSECLLDVICTGGTTGSNNAYSSTNTLSGQEVCDNNLDDDANGFVDCVDYKCYSAPHCISGTGANSEYVLPLNQEICTDGIDNDNDGLVDCNDSECACGITTDLQDYGTFTSEERLTIENKLLLMQPKLDKIKTNLEVLRDKYRGGYPLEANWAGVLATKLDLTQTYIEDLLNKGSAWPDSKYYSVVKMIKNQLTAVVEELNQMPLEHEEN